MSESERETRKLRIDPRLEAAGWPVIEASLGRDSLVPVAVREFETSTGPADYALIDDGKALAVVEAKKVTLGPQEVLTQALRYSKGVEGPPLYQGEYGVPFLYSTNGEIIRFQDARHPLNRSRQVCGFHTIAALRELLERNIEAELAQLAELEMSAVLALWDRWLWRLSWIQRSRKVARDLNGTWKGSLVSFWSDPETGKQIPEKDVYLVIRQRTSAVSVTLLTDESRSKSSLAVVSIVDGDSSLDYLYLNRPNSRFEHRSRMHHGSTSLDVTGCPATRLKGRYWTDRDTKGELDFIERRSQRAEDFDEAAALFE
jgi:SMODS-associating 2TM, beta-strand rich effector domain